MKVSATAAPTEPPQDIGQAAAADVIADDLQWLDDRVNRVDAADALVRAILACHPDDRKGLLEAALEHLRAGQPVPPFTRVAAEAAWWADMASVAELKAYIVACFIRLSPDDRDAFLEFIRERAAA